METESDLGGYQNAGCCGSLSYMVSFSSDHLEYLDISYGGKFEYMYYK